MLWHWLEGGHEHGCNCLVAQPSRWLQVSTCIVSFHVETCKILVKAREAELRSPPFHTVLYSLKMAGLSKAADTRDNVKLILVSLDARTCLRGPISQDSGAPPGGGHSTGLSSALVQRNLSSSGEGVQKQSLSAKEIFFQQRRKEETNRKLQDF
jgi:hypothetical protein